MVFPHHAAHPSQGNEIMKRFLIPIMIMIGCSSILVFRSIPAEEVKSQMRVGVFKEDLPGVDAGIADVLKNRMEQAGFTAEFITAGQAADSIEFSRTFYDLLVIPESRTFPIVWGQSMLFMLFLKG